ncbi:transcriptional regulator, HxlR family [Mesorhizobium albiziae]|uniref:Transcriptional regulator, HxlR family n=1 Tax=Neomesorhizobium albiziae TaxID=335020 RepID=A0A1I3VH00_9HYPH|nr:helix-turn-helix domain-containing protein [Mesorhizobium albiziae]SFJ94289.1 transcriptional regulator, HxlR family [Mesorhizobium albiziae]
MRPKNLLGPNSGSCPTRVLIDQLADKWAILVMLALAPATMRFNALRREVEGITQKMLGQTLRKLERNGLVCRRAYPTMPITVEYSVTDLGRTLLPVIEELRTWSMANINMVTSAQKTFDQTLQR